MSFVVKVEGMETFEISKECVKSVKVATDIPQDSNARTKDVGATMTIKGKILTAVGGDPFDSTRKLALWSVVPAERSESYRKLTAEYVAAGIVERKYCFPNAFVVDYREDYGDEEGTGTFTLVIKQKKDKINMITVEGGYSA
ncbi:MAG: membrane-associated protease 1 [Lachnospiraceae bacterium]|nr:membrane-associated protease 1 [Lachnospiraceae bacterium]